MLRAVQSPAAYEWDICAWFISVVQYIVYLLVHFSPGLQPVVVVRAGHEALFGIPDHTRRYTR
jgi:hypothetical protein